MSEPGRRDAAGREYTVERNVTAVGRDGGGIEVEIDGAGCGGERTRGRLNECERERTTAAAVGAVRKLKPMV